MEEKKKIEMKNIFLEQRTKCVQEMENHVKKCDN